MTDTTLEEDRNVQSRPGEGPYAQPDLSEAPLSRTFRIKDDASGKVFSLTGDMNTNEMKAAMLSGSGEKPGADRPIIGSRRIGEPFKGTWVPPREAWKLDDPKWEKSKVNPFGQQTFERVPATEILKKSNISNLGAPIGIRNLMGYGHESYMEVGVQKALSDHYGEDIQVRMGVVSGRLEFLNPEDKRWTVADPVGLDIGDFPQIKSEIPAVALALLGTAGGAAWGAAAGGAGPISGTLVAAAGEIAGFTIGEYNRLKKGQAFGVVDPEWDKIRLVTEASLIAGMASLGGVALSGMVRFLARSMRGQAIDIDPVELENAILLRTGIHEEVGTQPTTGQILRESTTGDLLLESEEQIAREGSEEARIALMNRRRANLEAGRQYFDEQSRTWVSEGDPEEVGQAVGDLAQQIYDDSLRAAEMGVEEASEKALRAYLDMRLGAGGVGVEAGKRARNAFVEAVERMDETAELRYGELRGLVAGKVTRLKKWRVFIGEADQVLDTTMFQSLVKEEKVLVKDALEFLKKNDTANYEQLSEAISGLKRLLRNADRGITKEPDIALVKRLMGKLSYERRVITNQVKGASKQLSETDAWYRGQNELLKNSVIGSILTKRHGVWAVADEDVFAQMFKKGNETNAGKVAQVLSEPGQEGALNALRMEIKNQWRDKVIKGDDLAIDSKAHKRFMQEYGASIKMFLSPEDAFKMRRAARLSRSWQLEESRLKKTIKDLDRTFEGKFSALDEPYRFFQTTWKTDSPALNRKVLSILKGAPGTKNQYRGLIKDHIFEAVTDHDPTIGRIINPKKLLDYLDGIGNDAGHARMLENWFSKDYVKSLRTLQKAMEDISAVPLGPRRKPTQVSAIYDLTRAYVGLFTRPGRVVTAYRKLSMKQGRDAVTRQLLHPESLAKTIRATRRASKLAKGAGLATTTYLFLENN